MVCLNQGQNQNPGLNQVQTEIYREQRDAICKQDPDLDQNQDQNLDWPLSQSLRDQIPKPNPGDPYEFEENHVKMDTVEVNRRRNEEIGR